MSSLILAHEGPDEMAGFLLDRDQPRTTFAMNGYQLDVSLDEIFGTEDKTGYGLVMSMGPGEFLGVGSGFRVSFSPRKAGPARAGIGWVQEGALSDDIWVPGRRLNGDESDQGRFWRFAPQGINVERVAVYRY